MKISNNGFFWGRSQELDHWQNACVPLDDFCVWCKCIHRIKTMTPSLSVCLPC